MKKILIIASLALFSVASMAKPISAETISPKVELVKSELSAFDLATPNFVLSIVNLDLRFVTVKEGEEISPLYPKPVSELITAKGFDTVAYLPPNSGTSKEIPITNLRY